MSVRRSMLAALALAGGAVFALAAPAQAAPAAPAALTAPTGTTEDPAQAAAGWLVTQLVGGNHLETVFGTDSFPDQGLTADAILAFDSAKVAHDSAAAATAWLGGTDVLTQYIGDGDTESFAGAHAKAALVAEAQGIDPHAFGGRDLLAELLDLQATSGRFSDRSQFGDFSNGIGQSLAVLALQRAGGSGAPAAAVAFLAGSQCVNGGFPLKFGEATCAPDPDTTAYVVQALLAAGQDAPAADALDWLESVQAADGGFAGSGPTAGTENSNSTGLVAQALRVAGRDSTADEAVGFLRARQVGCGAPGTQLGAIAYDKSGFAATAARATTQAIPGIAGSGLFTVAAAGGVDGAPTLFCAPPTTTSAPPTTSAPTTSTAAPSTSAPAGAIGGGGTLPNTGTPVGVLSALATALLASGILLVRAGRRRAVRALRAE